MPRGNPRHQSVKKAANRQNAKLCYEKQNLPPWGVAERSEFKISMLAGGKHTTIKQVVFVRNEQMTDEG